jgi:divalent metal cation (Fe/Co/Zn/Cd) transporter
VAAKICIVGQWVSMKFVQSVRKKTEKNEPPLNLCLLLSGIMAQKAIPDITTNVRIATISQILIIYLQIV